MWDVSGRAKYHTVTRRKFGILNIDILSVILVETCMQNLTTATVEHGSLSKAVNHTNKQANITNIKQEKKLRT